MAAQISHNKLHLSSAEKEGKASYRSVNRASRLIGVKYQDEKDIYLKNK